LTTSTETPDPNNIAKIFARDPLERTDDELRAMIQVFREKRALFKAGGSTAKAAKPEAKKVDLGSLEL
jgi:hypothetical protein